MGGADQRADRRHVGLLSVHTSPLEQPGRGDSGGMNVYLASLAATLAGDGHDVEVFTRASGRDLPPTVETEDGYRVHHIEAGPAAATKEELASHLCAFYLGLAGHPRVAEVELLHAHYWMSGWVGRLARRRLGLPLVQTFHTLARVKNEALAVGDVREPALRLAAEDRIVADADAIVAPTPDERSVLLQRYRASSSAVHLVEPGVDLDVFTAEGDRLAERAALGGGRIVLFVGRLQPLKGPDLAVHVLAALAERLPADGPPVRLVVVGGPSGNGIGSLDATSLARLAEELGVADRLAVLAPRPQTELAALYRAADAVLVPSHSESFGLVALEAQACGTPVVASDVAGLRHAVGAGAGTLVTGREPGAFASALEPYLRDAEVRRRAGAAGVRHAAQHSWRRTADGTLAVYSAALAERGVAPDRAADRQGA